MKFTNNDANGTQLDLTNLGFTPNTTLTAFLDVLKNFSLDDLNLILASDFKQMYLSLNASNKFDIYLTDDYTTLSKDARKNASINMVRDFNNAFKRHLTTVINVRQEA
jgi:uncharacterized membrane protein